ncbi:hypothetical protein PHISP_05621 [Aspergillus sp. HF37]|nr:hypothetical protein PHISP_05621 [Aspergillus sp. HF37]
MQGNVGRHQPANPRRSGDSAPVRGSRHHRPSVDRGRGGSGGRGESQPPAAAGEQQQHQHQHQQQQQQQEGRHWPVFGQVQPLQMPIRQGFPLLSASLAASRHAPAQLPSSFFRANNAPSAPAPACQPCPPAAAEVPAPPSTSRQGFAAAASQGESAEAGELPAKDDNATMTDLK